MGRDCSRRGCFAWSTELRAMAITIDINDVQHILEVPEDMPRLWVVQDELGLNGTKFGCAIAQCGACTMHVDGKATRTCVLPVTGAVGKRVHAIESISHDNSHPVQRAWIAEQVPQCGYCQSAKSWPRSPFFQQQRHPTDAQIDEVVTNICRCGTYDRIRAAIHRAAAEM